MRLQNCADMEKFRVRPGYKSKELLVEFCGDHRADAFPNIAKILAQALDAKAGKHPDLNTTTLAMATDEFISYWTYRNGSYEIDDDVWACFILAPQNNVQIIADIENALLNTGLFVKDDVEYGKYA
jgi:hypothetical protein